MMAIPAPIQVLLDVFTTHLAEVRFADLDGATLVRCAAEVEAASIALATAQLGVDAAREALQEKHDLLLLRAQRALAYARVYAECDEALSQRLDAVILPRPARRVRAEDALVLSADPQPPPRPRGRPRKERGVSATEPTLDQVLPPAE
jgi:hypothetical protein